ncbi:hypothetical protein IW150_007307, partial [Coemansia sp. RSA 2607]
EVEQENIKFSTVQWAWLRQAVSDRTEKHKPLQYILGNQPFIKANISLRPPILIPRCETEVWMLRLFSTLNLHMENLCVVRNRLQLLNILDACTGTGCVALGIARGFEPESAVIADVDISDEAIKL